MQASPWWGQSAGSARKITLGVDTNHSAKKVKQLSVQTYLHACGSANEVIVLSATVLNQLGKDCKGCKRYDHVFCDCKFHSKADLLADTQSNDT